MALQAGSDLSNVPNHLKMLFVSAVRHIQSEYIHPGFHQGGQHLWIAAGWANSCDNAGAAFTGHGGAFLWLGERCDVSL
jgi:hypothetical protein